MKLRAYIEGTGKTAAGMEIPAAVVDSLGAGKRPAVKATINGRHTYRSTIAVMGGRYLLGVSNEHRAAAGVAAGDTVDLELELDTAPREVTVPPDLARALKADPKALRYFEGLSYSNRLRHVLAIEGAKAADTRERRIARSVALFREGRN